MSSAVRSADDVSDFECAICQEVLLDPVRLSCAHVFCSECLSAAVRLKSECPVCRAKLEPGARFQPARDLVRQMDGIRVRCSYKGCGAVVVLSKLRAHQASCRYAAAEASETATHVFKAPEGHRAPPPTQNRSTFTCPYCHMQNLPRKDLLEHVNSKHSRVPAAQRQVVCPICASMPWGDPHRTSRDFNSHINERHMFDYAEYCDFEGSEEALVTQALRESRMDAQRREAEARRAPPPSAYDDEDEQLRLAIEASLRDY